MPKIFGILMLLSATSVVAQEPVCSKMDQSHGLWTALLAETVQNGVVNYKLLKTRKIETQLDAYLDVLSQVCETDYRAWPANQKKAFLLNSYNAFIIKKVLDNWPLESVLDYGEFLGISTYKIFREEFIKLRALGEKAVSLDTIENKKLRVHFKDPRIHFALVCASKSCPDLMPEAYTGKKLSQQLDHAGKAFLADSRKNKYDPVNKIFYLSKIFKWYQKDFGTGRSQALKSLSPYMPKNMLNPLGKGITKVRYLKYDWALNE